MIDTYVSAMLNRAFLGNKSEEKTKKVVSETEKKTTQRSPKTPSTGEDDGRSYRSQNGKSNVRGNYDPEARNVQKMSLGYLGSCDLPLTAINLRGVEDKSLYINGSRADVAPLLPESLCSAHCFTVHAIMKIQHTCIQRILQRAKFANMSSENANRFSHGDKGTW